jgi:hypothetical protein
MATDDDRLTPADLVDGTWETLRNRQRGVRDVLDGQRKAPNAAVQYLRGYYDALDLAADEVKQLRDMELMGLPVEAPDHAEEGDG